MRIKFFINASTEDIGMNSPKQPQFLLPDPVAIRKIRWKEKTTINKNENGTAIFLTKGVIKKHIPKNNSTLIIKRERYGARSQSVIPWLTMVKSKASIGNNFDIADRMNREPIINLSIQINLLFILLYA